MARPRSTATTAVRTKLKLKAKPRSLRAVPQGAFDQYLLDIQRLPMITDPAEERALAHRALAGDQVAAERLVTANLRFVIAYVKKYQGHGLDLSELVAIAWKRGRAAACSRLSTLSACGELEQVQELPNSNRYQCL